MEERDQFNSPLDRLFDDLRKEKPNHIAVRTFYAFREKAPGKTAKSVLISLDARLNMLQIDAVQEFLSYDTVDLRRFCTEKSVIFAITSDVDVTYNFLLNMFLNQLFVYAYRLADREFGGKLPVPVRIIYEEMANTAMPKDFPRVLSTCRKRNISIAIVVQEISQLKKLFKEDYEAVIANTSLRVFLGGESTSQLENIVKELGKATIKYDTLGKSAQITTTNINITGRELMTLDELRRMKKDESIVFLQYRQPIKDRKMQPEKHKRFSETHSGGAPAYRYEPPQKIEY
jgi:type IV secretion system protein VirD4